LLYRLPTDVVSVLAVGLFERYDAEWNYAEQVRSATTDDLEVVRDVESDGRLRSWTLAYGTEVLDAARIGIAVHRYFGTMEDVSRVAPVTGAETVSRLSRDLAGWGWTLGALVEAGPRLSVGASFEAPVKLDGSHMRSAALGGTPTPLTDVPDDGDYEVEYPATVSFGLSLRPRNELRTVFSIEARYRWWENLEDSYVDAEVALAADDAAAAAAVPFASPVRNTWDFRGGVEHRFYNEMPLRFGFRYVQNYADLDSERTVFSAGTGYRLGALSIDLTGQYHRQTSRQEFVFDTGASGIANPNVLPKVEDGVVRFVLGVSRGF
jgi:long-subunit fatty acid transport protein